MTTIDPDSPRVTVNDVEYGLLGLNEADADGNQLYVWAAVVDPEYHAPAHVSAAADEQYELATEIYHAERAAGWWDW